MKTDSIILLLFLVFMSSFVAAQVPKMDTLPQKNVVKRIRWEGGFLLGGTAYTGDVGLAIARTRPVVGVFVRHSLGNYFAFNASLYEGMLSGSDIHAKDIAWRVARNIYFNSVLTELSARVEYHFLGNLRQISALSSGASVFDETSGKPVLRTKLRKISPFIFVGGGLIYTNPKTNFNDSPSKNPITEAPRIASDKAVKPEKIHFVTPFGGGLRMPLVNSQTVLTLEGGFRPTFYDYLDGVSIAGNPNANDWYFIGSVGLSRVLGYTKDSDKDGVADKYDRCPFLKGDALHNGCPDRDGDGITDDKDECPTMAGLAIYDGCPDTDGDGIIDKFDECPTVSGSGRFKGCPTERLKKDTVRTLAVILDTLENKIISDNNASKTIEIKNSASKTDSLMQNGKPVSEQIPPQYQSPQIVEKPVIAVKPTVITTKDTLISTLEKPKQAVIMPKDTPQYQAPQIVEKPVIAAKPTLITTKDTLISTIEKPKQAVIMPKDTPQYQAPQIVEKPVIAAEPTVVTTKDTLISSIERPKQAVIMPKDTPQYQSPYIIEKPVIAAKPTVVTTKDTLISSTIERPKQAVIMPKDTPQYQSPQIAEKPVTTVKPTVVTTKDTLISTSEKIKQVVTPLLDAPDSVTQKPVKTVVSEKDTSSTNMAQSKVETKQFLENASVGDSVSNAFNITRNHYTISPIYFDHSKSIYKMESFVILDEVAYILLDNPTYKALIKGHTDATGTKEGNKALSISRAKTCYTYLVRKGVPAKQLIVKGLGQTEPVAGNDTEKNKQLNRRVEFEIRD